MQPPRTHSNLAARMGRWSAAHWKKATFGWLAFVIVAFALARKRPAIGRAAFMLVTLAGAFTAFGVIAPFLPGLRQGSIAVIALAAPIGLAAAWTLRERLRPDPSPAT